MSISYLTRANSCTGMENILNTNLYGIKKVYCINSFSEYLKSVFIGRVSGFYEKHDNDMEYIISPFDKNEYDGLILRDRGIAVINSTCINKSDIPDMQTVFLDSCINGFSDYDKYKITVKTIEEKYNSIYDLYKKAKVVHDRWENVYISNMDMDMLNKFCDKTIKKIFENTVPTEKKGVRYDRFMGGAFKDGNIDCIDSLSNGLSKRYFIKGRPGTGKSTFLKKVVQKSLEFGYDTEVYHCGFDALSLDMVIIRDLSLCVFDSTSPHEKFPENVNDEILDFYTNSGLFGVDEKNEKNLFDIKTEYSELMSKAKKIMGEAHVVRDELRRSVEGYIDYEIFNNLVYEILNNIY